MTKIKIKRGDRIYDDFEMPSGIEYNGWFISNEDLNRVDRDSFIVDEFIKDWPTVNIPLPINEAYSRIGSLASRNEAVRVWLALANAKYSLEASVPNYIKSNIDPQKFRDTQKSMTEYSKEVAKLSVKNQKAAEDYKLQLKKNEDEFNKVTEKYKKDKLLLILNLQPDYLPAEISNAIEDYVPVADDAPDTRQYARETLMKFKLYLLQKYNEDPNIDMQKLIDDLRGKIRG